MSKAKEHFYNKLKESLLQIDYYSSDLSEKAKYLKQQEEKTFVKKVEGIRDYLLEKMKVGDGIAYALYRVVHEDELSKISELNDFSKIKDFILAHLDLKSPTNDSYFDPKVVYFAEVLGTHSELWSNE